MGEAEMTLMRRANEPLVGGELREAFALWSEDGIGIPRRDWPERGPWNGPAELQRAFEGWSAAFGADWMTHLVVSRQVEMEDGRILSEYGFKTSGSESGVPVDQELAGIYMVERGRLVKGEFFVSHLDARRAAGLQ
jgi:ketosteroid isomerase-like protein